MSCFEKVNFSLEIAGGQEIPAAGDVRTWIYFTWFWFCFRIFQCSKIIWRKYTRVPISLEDHMAKDGETVQLHAKFQGKSTGVSPHTSSASPKKIHSLFNFNGAWFHFMVYVTIKIFPGFRTYVQHYTKPARCTYIRNQIFALWKWAVLT